MRLAIMQPYFFPYLGYFSLIKHTDELISFDTAQYIRHGWVNRNRILKPGSGWQYIRVPVAKHSQKSRINEVEIADKKWGEIILRQLDHYKKKAKYYRPVVNWIKTVLDTKQRKVFKLNVELLEAVCDYLKIGFKHRLYSELDINIGPVRQPGEWALKICEAVGASEYVNPPGGGELFDRRRFKDSGVELFFIKNKLLPYSQLRGEFVPGLSVIDVLMHNSVEDVHKLIDAYDIYE